VPRRQVSLPHVPAPVRERFRLPVNRKGQWDSPLPVLPRLVLASALMLFLELALIRWSGSNIVHLSYFSNFVLLGSFLGIGLGFLRAGSSTRTLPWYSPVTLCLFVAFVLINPVTVDRGSDSNVIYFTSLSTTGPPAWLILPIVFCAAAAITAGPAELTGRCFLELPRLTAYRYDLVGSLAGIGAFTALSFAQARPVWWGALAAIVFVVLVMPAQYGRRLIVPGLLVALPMGLVVGLLQVESDTDGVRWSPYYKIGTEVAEFDDVPVLFISANGVPHQIAAAADARVRWEPQYALPYQRSRLSSPSDVLIIGAGSGSDAAIALDNGAQHVDAVEIDPALLQLGRDRHPDQPYSDPRVDTHIDDGRAFLSGNPDKRYDLILFALPDSLTLVQGASSLRLESYLFTVEAFRSARDHLKPGGALALFNYYREPWLIDRLALTAEEAFGHRPCVDMSGDELQQAVITVGLTEADQRCATAWPGPAAGTPEPATDNRPFLYVFGATIPLLYLWSIALIVAVSVVAVALIGGGSYRRMRPYADLFLLGVGFLLLNTKSITGFALLFGTTWVVNAIVFAGVLVVVLVAVEVTRRFPTPPIRTMYVVLFGGLLLAWLIPSSWLLAMPIPLRAVCAIGIAFLPIFAANVVFAKRFADTDDATAAFGANLLGAMVGGCLEYLGLIVGFSGLLGVAALVYAGALALLPRSARA
jgi:SAM-dependent methyltransferase